MATRLKLSFRKRKGILYVQIVEQNPRKLKFTTAAGYQFNSVACPEVDDGIFHVRGRHSDRDKQWTDFPNDVPADGLVAALRDFAVENGFGIKGTATSSRELVVTIDDEDTVVSFTVATIINVLNGLGDSPDSAFKEDVKCSVCSKADASVKFVDTGEQNILICKDCVAKYSKCEMCNSLREKLIDHKDSLGKSKKVCNYCKTTITCENCSFKELKLEQINFYFIDNDGETKSQKLCMKCGKDNKNCNYCGNFYVRDYPDCPCRIPRDFKGMVQAYNTDVTQILSLDEDCIMGMELEVGVALKNRPYFLQIYNQTIALTQTDAIAVYDSSIDYLDGSAKQKPNKYRGFELVTRPMNKRNLIKFVYKFTEGKHKLLKSWDVETAGIHIHYSRRYLTKIEIGKLLVFLNSPNNTRLIKFIARRYSPKYAKLHKKKITDWKDKSKEAHYNALNTNKPHTIEFRIFRGSLKKETLLSYVQFVESSIAFVRATATENLTAENYLTWIQTTERSLYRDLKAHLATLNPKGKLMLIGGDE